MTSRDVRHGRSELWEEGDCDVWLMWSFGRTRSLERRDCARWRLYAQPHSSGTPPGARKSNTNRQCRPEDLRIETRGLAISRLCAADAHRKKRSLRQLESSLADGREVNRPEM